MTETRQLLREARRTLALAVPIIVGQLGQILLGVIDAVMIGQVGRVPLAASAFVLAVVSTFLLFGIGLLASVSVLVARATGAGRAAECGEILRHGMGVAAATALVVGACVTGLSGHLAWFGQPPEVAVEARPFLLLFGWSVVPALLFQCLKQYCEGMSAPTPPMVFMLGAVLINVALNWVLIYGNLGAPALGLVGAGCASMTARVAALVALLVHVQRGRRFAGRRPARWFAAPEWARFGPLLAIGLPVALQLLFEAGVFNAAGVMMGWLGTVPLAAHQIALSCAATTFMVPLGLSLAVGVRIAQAAGAGEGARIRAIGRGTVAMALLFMGGCALVFLTAGEWIAAGFVADVAREAPLVELAAQLLVVAGVFQLFDGTQVVSIGALRGLMDVRVPTAITFVAYWVVALPCAYLAGFRGGLGARGIWIGLATGLAVSALALVARFEWRSHQAAGRVREGAPA